MINNRLGSIFLLLCLTAREFFGSQAIQNPPLNDLTSENGIPLSVKLWDCSLGNFSPIKTPQDETAEGRTPLRDSHKSPGGNESSPEIIPAPKRQRIGSKKFVARRIAPVSYEEESVLPEVTFWDCVSKPSSFGENELSTKESPAPKKLNEPTVYDLAKGFVDPFSPKEEDVTSVYSSQYSHLNDYLNPITNLSTMTERDTELLFDEFFEFFCSKKYQDIEDLFLGLSSFFLHKEDLKTFVNIIVNINLNQKNGNVDLRAGDRCTNLSAQHFVEQLFPNGRTQYYLQRKLIMSGSYFGLIQELFTMDKALYDYFALSSIVLYSLNLLNKIDSEISNKVRLKTFYHNYLIMINYLFFIIKMVYKKGVYKGALENPVDYHTLTQATLQGFDVLIEHSVSYTQASSEELVSDYLVTLEQAKNFLPFLNSLFDTLLESFYLFSFEFLEYKKMMEYCKRTKSCRFDLNFEKFCTNPLLIDFVKEVYSKESLGRLYRIIPKIRKRKRIN